MCMSEGHQCKGGKKKKKYIYIYTWNLDKGNQRDNSGQIKVSFILPFHICILFWFVVNISKQGLLTTCWEERRKITKILKLVRHLRSPNLCCYIIREMGFGRTPHYTAGESPWGSLDLSCNKDLPHAKPYLAVAIEEQGRTCQSPLTLLPLTLGFRRNTKLENAMLLVIYYLLLQKSITRRDLLKLKLQNNFFRWTFEEECVGDKIEFGRSAPW